MHPTFYYKMDADQHVLDGLRMDTGVFVENTRQKTCNALATLFVSQAADILIQPSEHPSAHDMQSKSFIGGGLVAYEAFNHSDLNTETIRRVTHSFNYQTTLSHLDSGKHDITVAMFDNLAAQGLKDHPELNSHVIKVSQFYTEVAQDQKYGIFATIGLGYIASQLDYLVHEYTQQQLGTVFGVNPRGIDWDSSLRDIDGND